MSSFNEINSSSSARSTSNTNGKVKLCPDCHAPMKRRYVGIKEELFYLCSPCDSVRRLLPDEEEEDVTLAVTARERHFLEKLHFSRAFI